MAKVISIKGRKAKKRGAKAAAKAAAKAPAEATEKVRSHAEEVELKARELAARAEQGDATAVEAMGRIVVTFEQWRKALARQREENAACAALVGSAEAKLANAVEEGRPVDASISDEDWSVTKLRQVEAAWQDLSEAKAEASERKGSAGDRVRKFGAALERAMKDGAQLTIPGT